MRIVDAHCHASPHWFEPVESLLAAMERSGVEQAVLVQDSSERDSTYLFDCARDHPGRFAVVVTVDASAPDPCSEMERLARRGASGVRFRATARAAGPDPLALWRCAARLGLAVSCGGKPEAFASGEFAEIIEAVRDVPLVIEHLGAGNQPAEADADLAARQRVCDLARYPNVHIKIHGLGEFCRRATHVDDPSFPFARPIPPFLDMAYRAFGADRMMWGSDFPPVSAREGYANALRLPLRELAPLTTSEQDSIFGAAAARVFPVRS